MSSSVIENFVVGIITSVVTGLVVWLWGKLRESRILNQKAAFFGISPRNNCLVVMNHNPRSPNTMSHGDIETLVEVVRLVSEIGGQPTIAPFDRILEPAGGMTEFCIGGPGSNQRTGVHLENYFKDVRVNPYLQNNPDSLAITIQQEKIKYERLENEYAILSRFYPYPSSHPVILICGQTARTNQGAIYYLIKNYNTSLREKFGNKKSFCLLLKLQAPLTYGHKSIKLVKDLTDIAFVS